MSTSVSSHADRPAFVENKGGWIGRIQLTLAMMAGSAHIHIMYSPNSTQGGEKYIISFVD